MTQNEPDRVRAVIIKDGNILTLRRDFDDEPTRWVFPRGGVETTDKNAHEALKRECKEEVNLEIKVGKMVYEQNYKGRINHFYLCTIEKGNANAGDGPEYTNPENYHGTHTPEWLPIAQLSNYDLRPNDLRNKIITNDIYNLTTKSHPGGVI